jgi:hypothetical protein
MSLKLNLKYIYIFFLSPLVLILCLSSSEAQTNLNLEPFGLRGKIVTSMSEYGGKLYVGTENEGAFRRNLYSSDTDWIYIGLQGKKIKSIYPHQVGPIGFGITAGLQQDWSKGDTNLTFCTNFSETNWFPSDSGMDRKNISCIKGLDGFPTPVICGETFAVGSGKIYMKEGVVWENIFDIVVGIINCIKVCVIYSRPTPTGIVWAGGETAIFMPFIIKTTDKGKSWVTYHPINGDNACNSLAIDPTNDSIVYAGMEGCVIKSTDQGYTWEYTGLKDTPDYYYGLAVDPGNSQHLFAGGTPSGNSFILYETTDGGKKWEQLLFESYGNIQGISSLLFDSDQRGILYISTLGDGIFLLKFNITTKVEDKKLSPSFELFQNYPNPFNSTTMISFIIPYDAIVDLRIFDILNREIDQSLYSVNELKNKFLSAGKHQFTFKASYLSSGIYYYCLNILNMKTVHRVFYLKPMILLK